MNIKIILLKILAVSVIITHLNSCGFYRPVDAREFPPEPEKRIQKNLEEGRGFRLMDLNKNKGGDFSFASSNEMWRASLDILNFMPLTSADYGGGLIITDWYSEQDNSRDSIKISVRFLSNEIRSDGLEIVVFSKKCDANVNCKVIKNNSEIENELKIAILKRAAKYKKDMIDGTPKRDLNTILTSDDRD
jgi:hypothetical protein